MAKSSWHWTSNPRGAKALERRDFLGRAAPEPAVDWKPALLNWSQALRGTPLLGQTGTMTRAPAGLRDPPGSGNLRGSRGRSGSTARGLRRMDNAPIRILLVEDNAGDSRLLREILREIPTAKFQLTQAERLAEALARLAAESFDLVLTDLTLPDSQGLETFQKIHAQARHTPVVVLSGVDDESLAITAVREGAQDYLVKGHLDARPRLPASRWPLTR